MIDKCGDIKIVAASSTQYKDRLSKAAALVPVYRLSTKVFLLDDCPSWAKYAAVDYDGIACWFCSKPFLDSDNRWMAKDGLYNTIERNGAYVIFNAENFKDSLIEKKPADLDICYFVEATNAD